MSQLGEAGRIIAMLEFFRLGYVVGAEEEIQIVLDQSTYISIDRVVDGIIHYGDCTHIFPKSTLTKKIMRDTHDSPLVGNCRYSYEYETPYVTGPLSMDVFRLYILLEYIDSRLAYT